MTNKSKLVRDHYTRGWSLQCIDAFLKVVGLDPKNLHPEDPEEGSMQCPQYQHKNLPFVINTCMEPHLLFWYHRPQWMRAGAPRHLKDMTCG